MLTEKVCPQCGAEILVQVFQEDFDDICCDCCAWCGMVADLDNPTE